VGPAGGGPGAGGLRSTSQEKTNILAGPTVWGKMGGGNGRWGPFGRAFQPVPANKKKKKKKGGFRGKGIPAGGRETGGDRAFGKRKVRKMFRGCCEKRMRGTELGGELGGGANPISWGGTSGRRGGGAGKLGPTPWALFSPRGGAAKKNLLMFPFPRFQKIVFQGLGSGKVPLGRGARDRKQENSNGWDID